MHKTRLETLNISSKTQLKASDLMTINKKHLNKEERNLKRILKKIDEEEEQYEDCIQEYQAPAAYEGLLHGQEFFSAHVSDLVDRFRNTLVYNASDDGTYLMDDNGDIVLCDGDVVYVDHGFEDPFIVRIALDDVNFDDTVNVLEFNREQAEILLDATSEATKKLNDEMKKTEEAAGKKALAEKIEEYGISPEQAKCFFALSDSRNYAPQNYKAHTRKLITHKKQFAAEILDID